MHELTFFASLDSRHVESDARRVHPYRSPALPPPTSQKVERGCYVRILDGGHTGIVLFLRGRRIHVKIAGVPPRYATFVDSDLERLG